MNKKVLIFTYYWPPAGGVAVQRFLKFAKYLPQYGWEPVIVTVKNGSYPYYDESLLKEIPSDLKVFKTKTLEPFELYNWLLGRKGKAVPIAVADTGGNKSLLQRVSEYIRANFFIPDARKGWKSFAIKQAEEILKTEKIDAIITTGPPHSTHLIGLRLKQKHGLKWIADFRDPWTGIFYNNFLPRSRYARERDKQMEHTVLRSADAVTVIGPGMKSKFEGLSSNTHIIFNGYDEEDFGSDENRQSAEEKFVIRYVGNMLGSQNIEALWRALSALQKKAGEELLFEIVGRADESVIRDIEAHGLRDNVRFLNFIDHAGAIRLMQQASMLVLIIPDVKDNGLIITGKIFEYIGSCSEILGIGPCEGDASKILNTAGRKAMHSYNDENGITKELNESYSFWKNNGTAYKYPADVGRVFSRKKQAGELSNLLRNIVLPRV